MVSINPKFVQQQATAGKRVVNADLQKSTPRPVPVPPAPCPPRPLPIVEQLVPNGNMEVKTDGDTKLTTKGNAKAATSGNNIEALPLSEVEALHPEIMRERIISGDGTKDNPYSFDKPLDKRGNDYKYLLELSKANPRKIIYFKDGDNLYMVMGGRVFDA